MALLCLFAWPSAQQKQQQESTNSRKRHHGILTYSWNENKSLLATATEEKTCQREKGKHTIYSLHKLHLPRKCAQINLIKYCVELLFITMFTNSSRKLSSRMCTSTTFSQTTPGHKNLYLKAVRIAIPYQQLPRLAGVERKAFYLCWGKLCRVKGSSQRPAAFSASFPIHCRQDLAKQHYSSPCSCGPSPSQARQPAGCCSCRPHTPHNAHHQISSIKHLKPTTPPHHVSEVKNPFSSSQPIWSYEIGSGSLKHKDSSKTS